MKLGFLLEKGDQFEAGDVRLDKQGHNIPVEVGGGVSTEGHDYFFRERSIDDYPPHVEAKGKIIHLEEQLKAATQALESAQTRLSVIPPMPQGAQQGDIYLLQWVKAAKPDEVQALKDEVARLQNLVHSSPIGP